jgi:hypothetical protein
MKFNRTISCALFSVSLNILLLPFSLLAQLPPTENEFVEQITSGGSLPANLLGSKSLVLHSYTFSDDELDKVQEYFLRAGIDAVLYYPIDMVLAGKDVMATFADQFVKREIANLVVLEKKDEEFSITFTAFNGKGTLVEKEQKGWTIANKNLTEALKAIVRTAATGYKKTNLLINTLPETGLPINPIVGKRNEFYAVDMKVDLVAIPKFGDEAMDRELEQIISNNFPFKYKMTEPGTPEKELRKQGMFYVLCFIHTRAKIAQQLMGYNTSKSETAVVSVTYPDGQQQLRNFPANTPVFKAYFKHIDSGNTFLGNKWDADETWQSALLNQIRGMKAELRLN